MSEPVRVGMVLESMLPQYQQDLGPRIEVVRTGPRALISNALREAVRKRDGDHCVWCWSCTDLQIDHVTPWSAGGSDDATNLRTLCKSCNERRSNHTSDASTAKPAPITRCCLRCTGEESDDTEQIAFCLHCERFTPTRSDQIRQAQRYFNDMAARATEAIAAKDQSLNPTTSLSMIYLREFERVHSTMRGKVRLARKAGHMLRMHWACVRGAA